MRSGCSQPSTPRRTGERVVRVGWESSVSGSPRSEDACSSSRTPAKSYSIEANVLVASS